MFNIHMRVIFLVISIPFRKSSYPRINAQLMIMSKFCPYLPIVHIHRLREVYPFSSFLIETTDTYRLNKKRQN